MNSQQKKKHSLVLGILSIVLVFVISDCRSDFGDYRIGLGYFISKRVTITL